MSNINPIIIFVLGTLLFTLFAVFTVMYIALQKKKQYHHHLEKQEMEHRYETELMQSRLEVQEQTLKNLSVEVHDGIGAKLSLAKMRVSELARRVPDNYKQQGREAVESIGDIVKRIRDISHVMNGTYMLQSGLIGAIKEDLQVIETSTAIKCDLKISGAPLNPGKDKELMLFRIIQESITNAVKHGQPKAVSVSIDYGAEAIGATIVDDGRGFDTEAVSKGGGMGQCNITERTKLLKGTVQISSQPGMGTKIRLQIPV